MKYLLFYNNTKIAETEEIKEVEKAVRRIYRQSLPKIVSTTKDYHKQYRVIAKKARATVKQLQQHRMDDFFLIKIS